MPKKTQGQLIEETHDTVIQLKTVLLGANGDTGLIGDFKEAVKKINTNEKRISWNRLLIYTLVALLIGTGILETIDIIKLIGG